MNIEQLLTQHIVDSRSTLIPQLFGYLSVALALLAHGAGKLYAVVWLVATLAQQRKGDALARSLEVKPRGEAQLKGEKRDAGTTERSAVKRDNRDEETKRQQGEARTTLPLSALSLFVIARAVRLVAISSKAR